MSVEIATKAARKAAARALGRPESQVGVRVWLREDKPRGRKPVDQGAVDAALDGATSYRDAEKRSGISARTLARERPNYFSPTGD